MTLRALALVFLIALHAVTAPAQEQEPLAPPSPALGSLDSGWWAYFEGQPTDIAPQVSQFLESIGAEIAALPPPMQVTAESVLEAVGSNLTAYLELLDDSQVGLQELPEPAESYSLDDLLRLAAVARDAQSGATADQLEVEREQRILNVSSRRRDAAFRDYVDARAGGERWLAGLRLVQVRSAQAISQRRLELLTLSYQRASAYAAAAVERVNLARQRLSINGDDPQLDALAVQVEEKQTAVDDAQAKLREAEVAAIGLDLETALGRSQQRLQQQTLIGAEVNLALAEVGLAEAQARRWWTELQLDTAPAMDVLEEQALGWSQLARSVTQRELEWTRETEDELLAVQSVNRDGLNRASRRLLDQRLGTAQETLARAGELDAAVEDLELLGRAVDSGVAKYSGRLKSWLSSLSREANTLFLRVKGSADLTLFSIGETPVTGGDIIRILIILALAFLLSRGVRHTIKRVSESDFSGTQASLYTVGRLTHYTIIILAIVIALSSIGFDFSNLALVAGALGVGIGFGLQSIVGNFVSGLIILFEHRLRVGDYIELDTELTGTVKAINVRSTLINTNDNIDIVVPNSEFVSNRLTNWTLGERILRVRIPFGVAYGSDKALVKQAAMEAAMEVPYTLTQMKDRQPDVWLVEFGDSALNFLLLVWVNREGARRPTRTRAAYLWALESKLTAHGIEIPFPQRDLHVRSGWPTAAPAG